MHRADFRDPRLRRLVDYIVEVRDELRGELVRIDVVDALADLPDNAPPNRWYRVQADPTAVYIGNGPTRPLSRFTTTPV